MEMDPMKSIQISCKGAGLKSIDELKEFQGEIKKLTPQNYQKLKNTILNNGFSAPIFIWLHENKNYILDGHQRIKVLQGLQKEGYKIPLLPVDYIYAKSKKEAKRKLLSLASIYGLGDKNAIETFIEESKLNINELINETNIIDVERDIKSIDYDYIEENIKPFKQTHILLSFPPEKLAQIKPYIEKILEIKGVEYEQASNLNRQFLFEHKNEIKRGKFVS